MAIKSFLDEMTDEKPESFSEETFSVAPKKKPVLLITIVVLVAAMALMIFLMSRVTVPDFTGWSSEQVGNWTKKNGPTIIASNEYTLETPAGQVINQGTEAGKKISKKSSIDLSFSQGADPNEKIEFLELKTMTVEEIQKWSKDNQLTGLTIKYENSDTIDSGQVISYEVVDGNKTNFLRKSRVKVSASKGPKALSETLSMTDLYGKSLEDVKKWALDNTLKIKTDYVYNDFVDKDRVISQSIPKDSKISRSDEITVTISKGAPVMVPNFVGLSSSEASTLAGLYDLRLFIRGVQSTGEKNQILSQDIEANTEIEKNSIVTLHIPKENSGLLVGDYVGMQSDKASELASAKGIKVFINSVESTEKPGMVLSQDYSGNSTINSDDFLTLNVSRGDSVMPKFVGLDKSKVEAMVEALGIKVSYANIISTHMRSGKIQNQSIAEGAILEAGQTLFLEVASNSSALIPDFSKMSKTEAEQWAKDKGVELTILDVYTKKYEKGQLFDQNHKGIYIPEGEALKVSHALGKVMVKSFLGQSKSEVIEWVDQINDQGANLTVKYYNTSSSEYQKGQISNQSKIDDYVEIGSEIKVYVCIAKATPQTGTTIPVVVGMTSAEFLNWCGNNQVSYQITESYHNTIAADKIMSQNYANQTISSSDVLKVTKSIGLVTLPDFTGVDKADTILWMNGVNAKYGGITLTFEEEASGAVAAGKVISQDVLAGQIQVGTTIIIKVSAGDI